MMLLLLLLLQIAAPTKVTLSEVEAPIVDAGGLQITCPDYAVRHPTHDWLVCTCGLGISIDQTPEYEWHGGQLEKTGRVAEQIIHCP